VVVFQTVIRFQYWKHERLVPVSTGSTADLAISLIYLLFFIPSYRLFSGTHGTFLDTSPPTVAPLKTSTPNTTT
jgi:hypothetical protein